ncbi:MAG: nitroreductase family protein [Candidatus Bathyarchaeota archaeon]
MEVLEAIETRRSVRRYKPGEIPAEDLEKILRAGQLAPSAGNRQPWRFVVVRGPETRMELAGAARGQLWTGDAGVMVAALAVSPDTPGVYARWVERDVMTATEHLVLAAWSLGYGTCWIGAFEEDEVKGILGVPEGMKVICLLPIGVPDQSPEPRGRKPFEEIFHGERYGQPLRL